MITCHFYENRFEIPQLKESQNLKSYFGGDIQKFYSKLPGFIWSRYPGEKHLPSYNYLGPGTRLDIRLNKNNNPKVGEKPINAIDHLAYIHDLAYQKSDNISDRHEADIQMINGLKQLKNLSIPQRLIRAMIVKLFQTKIKLGQGSRAAKTQAIENLYASKGAKTKLHSNAKSKDIPYKLRNELDKRHRLAEELHKLFRKPPQYSKVNFRSIDNIWNADLIIVSRPENSYKYTLTVMGGFTRYEWAVPLKDKKGKTAANAFKEIMKKSNRKPNKLWVDRGKEFYNQHMYLLLN